MNKVCYTCKKLKENKFFGVENRSKDKLQSSCKECKREYDNIYHKKRNSLSLEKKKISQNLRYDSIRIFIYKYLQSHGCVRCKEKRIAALDFHHLKDKLFNISNFKGKSLENVEIEINKCIVLCSNCHRVETAIDLNWYSYMKE